MIPDFVSDPSQPAAEHLPGPYLLFSATFDGDLEPFLEQLPRHLPDEAEPICRAASARPSRRGARLSRRISATTRSRPACSSPLTRRRPSRKSYDALGVRQRAIDFAVRARAWTTRRCDRPSWRSSDVACRHRSRRHPGRHSRGLRQSLASHLYLFLSLGDDPASGRAWLGDQLPAVTTAVRWTGQRPESTFNLAVTSMRAERSACRPRWWRASPTSSGRA